MAFDYKLKYVLLILLSLCSLSLWSSSADELIESMLMKLQDSYDQIPFNKVKVDYFRPEKSMFKRFAQNRGNTASYIYLKEKAGQFVEDYGMMYKRLGIAKFTFVDSAICDSFMENLLGYLDVPPSDVDSLLNGPGFVESVHAPQYLLLKTSSSIIKVFSRCADYPDPDGDRGWKQMVKMLLGYPEMILTDTIVICYCGGPLLIADSAYFSNDSILPLNRTE